MFSTSDRRGFTLVETLIAILILSIASLMAFLPNKPILSALGIVRGYFSPEKPADSILHAYQLILTLEETLMKKGYGTAIPDVGELLNSEDVEVHVEDEVDVYSYAGEDMLEVITIVATYTTPSGHKSRIVEKVVRGRF